MLGILTRKSKLVVFIFPKEIGGEERPERPAGHANFDKEIDLVVDQIAQRGSRCAELVLNRVQRLSVQNH